MVLYKLFAVSSTPSETFLGNFSDLPSAKYVIRHFDQQQHKVITDMTGFKRAITFEELERTTTVKVLQMIVKEDNNA